MLLKSRIRPLIIPAVLRGVDEQTFNAARDAKPLYGEPPAKPKRRSKNSHSKTNRKEFQNVD